MSFENNFESNFNRLEKEYYPDKEFHIEGKLISVDGADGVGKSSFSEKLTELLQEKYGRDGVVLVRPTKFVESEEAQDYGDKLHERDDLRIESRKHNLYFIGALHKNYQKKIKGLLEDGKIVVLDSSEIRALAYVLDRGDEDASKSTLKWLRSGRLTGDALPGNRVLLSSAPQDILDNLNAREKTDRGDPVDYEGVKKRLEGYNQAIGSVKHLKTDDDVNWVEIQNPRLTEGVDAGLEKIIRDQVLDQIKI